MDNSSRTFKSIRNSATALLFFGINFIMRFISRKVFIDYLGAEVLGLNTTATSLLSFLNLAELGVGAAVTFTLYKPLNEKDYKTINEIVSVQGWLYQKVAYVVIAGAGILMLFFPIMFQKMELPLWYAYASFGVLLFSSLLSYFVNYKQIVLAANQQDYKVQFSYQSVLILKVLCQILCVTYSNNGYVWWLLLEALFAIFASLSLNLEIKKSQPYLKTNIKDGNTLRKKYPVIITKIKQFFFHKIAGFVLRQTSPLIIYTYANLTLVAIYGNYMLVVYGLTQLLDSIFNGMQASVGNLVSEADKDKILNVFKELFLTRFLLVSTSAYGIYMFSDAFMKLWLGEDYILDHVSLLLIVVIFFLNTQRSVVDSFINAFGLFKDIWAPMAEAALNLGLSLILGYYYGLRGILSGVVISLILIIFMWKPYFLFKEAMKQPLIKYIKLYLKLICIGIISILITNLVVNFLPLANNNYLSFAITAFVSVMVCAIIQLLLMYLFEDSTKSFILRFIHK